MAAQCVTNTLTGRLRSDRGASAPGRGDVWRETGASGAAPKAQAAVRVRFAVHPSPSMHACLHYLPLQYLVVALSPNERWGVAVEWIGTSVCVCQRIIKNMNVALDSNIDAIPNIHSLSL